MSRILSKLVKTLSVTSYSVATFGIVAFLLPWQGMNGQSGSMGSGTNVTYESSANDVPLTQQCSYYPNYACIVVAVFDTKQASYWYVNGGSSDGIPGTPIYLYVNGVYSAQYHANNTYNPGAITVIGTIGQNWGFLGAQYYNGSGHGNCTNLHYSGQSWNLTTYYGYSPNGGEVYTLGIPYSCTN